MECGDLYKTWIQQRSPKPVTGRMVRKAIWYVATAQGTEEWESLTALPEQCALALLDGALGKTELSSQSRSNYRNYLRRLYRFAAEEGLDLANGGGQQMWTPAPTDAGVGRRAQIAYERFVRWAIGMKVWPDTVKPQHLLDWAQAEKIAGKVQWRQEYTRLQTAWSVLVSQGQVPELAWLPLPPRLNLNYAIPIEQWPADLREEWRRMCKDASAPLRKGGMRPWRAITQGLYEKRLACFLGWFASEYPAFDLASETWASLLTAERCQAYLNWLVGRTGNGYINPGHTAFLRMARGVHRVLQNSPAEVAQSFTELCKRCDVEQRDKAARMAPYPTVEQAFRRVLGVTSQSMKPDRRRAVGDKRLATAQVNTIIFGLLTSRALRCANIVGITVGKNLVKTATGYHLCYEAKEMKGHRKFETPFPAELIPVLEDYLTHGYKALTGRMPSVGERLLISGRGTPLDAQSLAARVRRMTLRFVGKVLHPHLFRHIVATHAAQVWYMTPPELAAFLAHRSINTVMRYYEVTTPARAAERLDSFRHALPA